jgi:hypothetical protein
MSFFNFIKKMYLFHSYSLLIICYGLLITECYLGFKTTSPNLVVTFMPIFFKN